MTEIRWPLCIERWFLVLSLLDPSTRESNLLTITVGLSSYSLHENEA